jgi:hypothetical protein
MMKCKVFPDLSHLPGLSKKNIPISFPPRGPVNQGFTVHPYLHEHKFEGMYTFLSRVKECVMTDDAKSGQHECNYWFLNVFLYSLFCQNRSVELYTNSKPENNV